MMHPFADKLSETLRYPYYLEVVDSALIIFEDDSREATIGTILNVTTGEVVNNFIKKGQGENELENSVFASLHKENQEIILSCYSQPSMKMIRYDLSSFSGGNYDEVILSSHNFEVEGALRVVPYDSQFIAIGIFDSLFAVIGSDQIKYQESLPFQNRFKDGGLKNLSFAYQFLLCQNPYGSKLATASRNAGVFEIFEIDEDNRIWVISSHLFYPPKFLDIGVENVVYDLQYNPDSKIGFLDMKATNDFIFLLYSEKTRNKIDGLGLYYSNIILKYDWHGNPVCRYKLDHEVNTIAVDDGAGLLYGITLDAGRHRNILLYGNIKI